MYVSLCSKKHFLQPSGGLNSPRALKVMDNQVVHFKKHRVETSMKQADAFLLHIDCFYCALFLTVELNRRWQMLQEMICFFLRG